MLLHTVDNERRWLAERKDECGATTYYVADAMVYRRTVSPPGAVPHTGYHVPSVRLWWVHQCDVSLGVKLDTHVTGCT